MDLFFAMRDATIQRFEYCADLMWKVLKVYLEEVEKVDIANMYPRGIIRAIVEAKQLSEDEGNECMNMVDSRNRTSHIYHQDMAEDIAQRIPAYYTLMREILHRLQLAIQNKK